MITEDYVSFEVAKLLKERGFDWEVHRSYLMNDNIFVPADVSDLLYRKDAIRIPTLQMAMKWLREEKGVAIIPVLSSILDNEKFLWDIKIVVAKTGESYSQGWIYEKQEEAFNTAIKYCLENLI